MRTASLVFTLVTFGGAGPLYADELIRNGDVPRAIAPYYPGILSAIGCLLADVRHDHVRSVNERIDAMDLDGFYDTIADLEERAESYLPPTGGHPR